MTKTIDELLQEAVSAWKTAQAACPERTAEDLDGPTCNRADNASPNGWCDPTYCPKADF
jgi:hypothetical protein